MASYAGRLLAPAVLAILRPVLCTVVTLITFISKLSIFERNPRYLNKIYIYKL